MGQQPGAATGSESGAVTGSESGAVTGSESSAVTGSESSAVTGADRGVTEWVLLALLAEDPAHGFALAKALQSDEDLGRVLTVRRPLVYRALDRLAEAGLAEPLHTEPGNAGPTRTVYRPTDAGQAELDRWLAQPVEHVRDLRVSFLAKLRLLERLRQPPLSLIAAQRSALDHKLERLINADGDVVDSWRSHNAQAASDFLDEIEARFGAA